MCETAGFCYKNAHVKFTYSSQSNNIFIPSAVTRHVFHWKDILKYDFLIQSFPDYRLLFFSYHIVMWSELYPHKEVKMRSSLLPHFYFQSMPIIANTMKNIFFSSLPV